MDVLVSDRCNELIYLFRNTSGVKCTFENVFWFRGKQRGRVLWIGLIHLV